MARRRYRKKEGLLDLAFRSDWKFSALLAGGCVFGGMVVVPVAFGRSPLLAPLGSMLSLLAWFLAFVFAAIAAIRYFKQHPLDFGALSAPRLPTTFHRDNGDDLPATTRREPGERDSAAFAPTAPDAPKPPARPESWSLDVLDRVEWKRFEDLCCEFYREKGIRAETTRLGADGGIDIRLFQDEADATRVSAIVQCKAWAQQVGIKPVRELRGVMAHEKADKAFFMAPNGFTADARAFAAVNPITLLDGTLFLAMLKRLPPESSQRLLEFATAGDWTTPTCPTCGDRMTARDSKRGPFWGCAKYPKCRGTLPMRASASQ